MNDQPRPPRWPWIFGILLLAGSALGAGWVLNHSNGNGGTPTQGTPTPQPAPIPESIVSIGFVDAEAGVADLYPLQPGRVKTVVAEGKHVTKGEVLLQLDDRLAELKVREAQADLDAAKEQLAQAEKLPESHQRKVEQQNAAVKAAQHKREAAKHELQIKENLYKDKTISIHVKEAFAEIVKQLDAAVAAEEGKLKELKLFNPQRDIERAKADVEAKQSRLEQAQYARDECRILAPADGLVLRVLVSPGEVLGPNPRAPALQFCTDGPRVVRAEILQEWASKVQEGQTVSIEDDTYAGGKWEGRIKRLSDWFAHKRRPIIEPFMYNDVRTLECLIEVDNAGAAPLRIGQRVRVRIKTGA